MSGGCADAGDGKLVEMRELYRDAAEIVPDAGEDLFDLGVGFLREGGAQIIAADAVLRAEAARRAHERAGEIGLRLRSRRLIAPRRPATRADDRIQKS